MSSFIRENLQKFQDKIFPINGTQLYNLIRRQIRTCFANVKWRVGIGGKKRNKQQEIEVQTDEKKKWQIRTTRGYLVGHIGTCLVNLIGFFGTSNH